jgi:hypothetical protein
MTKGPQFRWRGSGTRKLCLEGMRVLTGLSNAETYLLEKVRNFYRDPP